MEITRALLLPFGVSATVKRRAGRTRRQLVFLSGESLTRVPNERPHRGLGDADI